jgi:hypothetical protein
LMGRPSRRVFRAEHATGSTASTSRQGPDCRATRCETSWRSSFTLIAPATRRHSRKKSVFNNKIRPGQSVSGRANPFDAEYNIARPRPNSHVTRGHFDQRPSKMAVAEHVAAALTFATDLCDTENGGTPWGLALSRNSYRPCENSPPHRVSATLTRPRTVGRNNDSPHGSSTHRYYADPTCSRVFTRSA